MDEPTDRRMRLGMDPKLEQRWLEEVHTRVAEYDAGEVEGIPIEETLAKLRAMIQ